MSSRGLEDGVPASKHGKGGGGGGGGDRGSSQSATSSLREGRDRQTANAHWRVSLVEMVRPGFRERETISKLRGDLMKTLPLGLDVPKSFILCIFSSYECLH